MTGEEIIGEVMPCCLIVLVFRNIDRPDTIRFPEIARRAGTIITKYLGSNRLKTVKRVPPDPELLCQRQVEEGFSHCEHTVTQKRLDAVTGDHQKADVFTGTIDLLGYFSRLLGPSR